MNVDYQYLLLEIFGSAAQRPESFAPLVALSSLQAKAYYGNESGSRNIVDDTLWRKFQELNRTLWAYMDEVTDRVIREEIHRDYSEAEVQAGPETLEARGTAP